jgi:hypothetical protein
MTRLKREMFSLSLGACDFTHEEMRQLQESESVEKKIIKKCILGSEYR